MSDKSAANRKRREHSRNRNRGIKAAELPAVALRLVAAECETALAALGQKPESKEVREFWRNWDARHGGRPDFVLWRRLRGGPVFKGDLKEVAALMLRAVRSPAGETRWAALALLRALPGEVREAALVEAVRAALRSDAPAGARLGGGWARWLARVWLGEEKAAVLLEEGRAWLAQAAPEWRVGRAVDWTALEAEDWLPVAGTLARRWTASALAGLVSAAGGGQELAWRQTIWLLLRDARPGGQGAGAAEVEALLEAAGSARAEGRALEAARLAALALQLTPERLPGRVQGRCRVAAWGALEAGLAVSPRWGVSFETMPFPGDPPDSARGREAAPFFEDPDDPAREALEREAAESADWQTLREAGTVLRHPLAALAWVARKAPSHAVKKQFELMAAAARLALRHGCLASAGKLLAAWPAGAELVLEYAARLRAGLRSMPVLRAAEAWAEGTASLRAAWGRLDLEAIHDPESLFALHETLADRLAAARLRLPEALLCGDEREVALALRADPRLLSVLEHQRALELWEVAELARREDLADTVWVSVALAGEPEAGRCSLLAVSAAGARAERRRFARGDLAVWLPECRRAVAELAGGAPRVLLALDTALPRQGWQEALAGAEVRLAATWEAAFREVR